MTTQQTPLADTHDSEGKQLSDRERAAVGAAKAVFGFEESVYCGGPLPGAADKIAKALEAHGWEFVG